MRSQILTTMLLCFLTQESLLTATFFMPSLMSSSIVQAIKVISSLPDQDISKDIEEFNTLS